MKSYNLQYYVDKLKNGERFSLARFGDGELYCMWGRSGRNSNGCWYTGKLAHALNRSIVKHKDDPTFIYGLQRVLPKDQERAEKYDVDWHDSEIFGEAVAQGNLYPLIVQLQKMKVCFVANESIRPVMKYFQNSYFVEVPPNNAYEEKEWILEAIEEQNAEVFLFSCGMAGNAFISKLHGKINATLLDVGHIWDPFVGNMSRCDLEGKTIDDILRNLKP